MFKYSKTRTVIGSALFAFGILSTATTQADLRNSVLDGLKPDCETVTNPAKCRINTKVQAPLGKVPVPEPSNLYKFVQNKQRAIELGKALFWDMQVGSDGVQACASCHFNAGADSRTKNQLSPGLLNSVSDPITGETTVQKDTTFEVGKGANYQLSGSDFPHHKLTDNTLFTTATLTDVKGVVTTYPTSVTRDTNDVTSSQGVHFSEFQSASTGEVVDETQVVADDDGFIVDGTNTRRVEPRNTPTMINAVYNHRNFWDGRASANFNGVNNFGERDPYAYVYQKNVSTGGLSAVNVLIDNGSLASQAMDPPVSKFEMSADGRTWEEIGDKLTTSELGRQKGKRVVRLRPLASQEVDRTDSVLGKLSAYPRAGLKTPNYDLMIRRAFRPEWWSSSEYVRINADKSRTIVPKKEGDNDYAQMEINFSLFFGLAVQLYQATLVADQTPFDAWLAGDNRALSTEAVIGFFIAHDEARCLNCHGGPELTFASVSKVNGLFLKDGTEIIDDDFPQGVTRIRRHNIIDEGFNNIGVRPTLEDLGVGGDTRVGPLSFARRTHQGENDLNLTTIVDDSGATVIKTPDSAARAKALGADGAFKIPGLRNVELTAPYFHNGGESTLEDVIDFYFRGGNFRKYAPTLLTDCASTIPQGDARLVDHPVQGFNVDRTEEVIITGLGILRGPMANSGPGSDTPPGGDCDPNDPDNLATGETNPFDGLDAADRTNLVLWLKSLTDNRVIRRAAPFDHPQLFVPNGHPGDHTQVIDDGTGRAIDGVLVEIPATGAEGTTVVQKTFEENLVP